MNRSRKQKAKARRDTKVYGRHFTDRPWLSEEDIEAYDQDVVYQIMTEPLVAAVRYKSNVAARALLRMINADPYFCCGAYAYMNKTYFILMKKLCHSV
jgi:hypothetical protein